MTTHAQTAAATRAALAVLWLPTPSVIALVRTFDGAQTLFYCDPPYPYATRNERNAGHTYRHEMTDDDHREMAAAVHSIQGMVIVSGYACDLYDNELFADWHRTERESYADGARDRTEVLWISPIAWVALRNSVDNLPLFAA